MCVCVARERKWVTTSVVLVSTTKYRHCAHNVHVSIYMSHDACIQGVCVQGVAK